MFVATVAPYIPCGTELMLTATIVMSIWLLIEIGFHLIAINADTGMWFVFYGGGNRSLHWCSCCMVDIPKDAKDQ